MDEGNFCPLRYFGLESKAKSTKIEAQQNKLLRGWNAICILFNIDLHAVRNNYIADILYKGTK